MSKEMAGPRAGRKKSHSGSVRKIHGLSMIPMKGVTIKRGKGWKKCSHTEVWGRHSGLYMI